MKKIFTIMMLCGVCYGYAQNTPLFAASTQTWTFGDQTWSDAIHVPACNKKDFTESDTKPDCRSYTSGANTWYYYNWAYVEANKKRMCPQPWQISTKADMETFVSNSNENTLFDAWRYGGYADGWGIQSVGEPAVFWVIKEGHAAMNYLWYVQELGGIYHEDDTVGAQVRCVK